MGTLTLGMPWDPERPRVLVAACSDGRLQEATDAFLSRALGVRQYDRLYGRRRRSRVEWCPLSSLA